MAQEEYVFHQTIHAPGGRFTHRVLARARADHLIEHVSFFGYHHQPTTGRQGASVPLADRDGVRTWTLQTQPPSIDSSPAAIDLFDAHDGVEGWRHTSRIWRMSVRIGRFVADALPHPAR